MSGVQSCKKDINLPAQVSKVGKATRQACFARCFKTKVVESKQYEEQLGFRSSRITAPRLHCLNNEKQFHAYFNSCSHWKVVLNCMSRGRTVDLQLWFFDSSCLPT